jgi:hypothetical protein
MQLNLTAPVQARCSKSSLHDHGHFQSESFCLWADRQIRCPVCIECSRGTDRHGNVQAGHHHAWDGKPERRYRDGIYREAAGTFTIPATYNGDAEPAKKSRNRQPDCAVGNHQNPPDFRRLYHTLVGCYSTWVPFTKSRPWPMLLIEQHLGEG